MNWFYLYIIATGVLVSESDREITTIPEGMAVKECAERQGQDGKVWDETLLDFVAAPAPVVRIVTPLAFLERFTPQERVAVRTLAKTDPAVEDYLDLLSKAQEVNLDSANTVGGLTYLEAQGCIAAGRAAEIRA